MKQKIILLTFLFFSLFAFTVFNIGCSDAKESIEIPEEDDRNNNKDKEDEDSSGENPGKDIEAEQRLLVENLNYLDFSIAKLFSDKDVSDEEINTVVNDFNNLPMISNVISNKDGIFVKLKNGGHLSWIYVPEPIEDFSESTLPLISNSSGIVVAPRGDSQTKVFPGNKEVALINVLHNYVDYTRSRKELREMQKEFKKNGYDDAIYISHEANVDFFRSELKKYGVIFLSSHGYIYEGLNWIMTAEVAPPNELLSIDFEWGDGLVGACTIVGLRWGKTPAEGNEFIRYKTISTEFLDKSYKKDDYPNTLFYTNICHGMGNDESLANILIGKGVNVVIGFNNTNTKGVSTGFELLKSMLNGYSLEKAYGELDIDSFRIDINNYGTAILLYHPVTSETTNMYLVDKQEEYKKKWIIIEGVNTNFWSANNYCPEGYRIPTHSELELLIKNEISKRGGWNINSPGSITISITEEQSLTFPANINDGAAGRYWSSSERGANGYFLYFDSGEVKVDYFMSLGQQGASSGVCCIEK